MTEPSALEQLADEIEYCLKHRIDPMLTQQAMRTIAAALRAAPAQGDPVAWSTLTGAATTNERTANIWRDVHGFTIEPLYAALPSSPAPGASPLHNGEREPVIKPALGAGEAIAEDCAKIAEGHVGANNDDPFYDEACIDIAKAIRDAHGGSRR